MDVPLPHAQVLAILALEVPVVTVAQAVVEVPEGPMGPGIKAIGLMVHLLEVLVVPVPDGVVVRPLPDPHSVGGFLRRRGLQAEARV